MVFVVFPSRPLLAATVWWLFFAVIDRDFELAWVLCAALGSKLDLDVSGAFKLNKM